MSEQPPLMWTDTLDSDDDSPPAQKGESMEPVVEKLPEKMVDKATLTPAGVTEENAEEGDEQAEGDEGDIAADENKPMDEAVSEEADSLAIENLKVSDAPQVQEAEDEVKHNEETTNQSDQEQTDERVSTTSKIADTNDEHPSETKSAVEEVTNEEDSPETAPPSVIQEQPSVVEQNNESKSSDTQTKGKQDHINRKDKNKDKTMRMWVHDGFEQQQREERMSTPQPARPKPAWTREAKTQARRGGYEGESKGEHQKPPRARRLSWGNDTQMGAGEEAHHQDQHADHGSHGNQTQDARGGRTMRTWGHDGYDQQQQQDERRGGRQQRSRRTPHHPDAPPDRTAQAWGHDGYNQLQEQEREDHQNGHHNNNNRNRQRGNGNPKDGAEDKLRSPWGHDGYMQQQQEEAQRRGGRGGFGGRRGSDLRSPHPESTDGPDEATEVLTKAPRERKVVRVRPGFGGSYVPPKRTEITMENSPLPPKPEEPRKNRSADNNKQQHQQPQLHHQQQLYHQQPQHHQQHQQHFVRSRDDNEADSHTTEASIDDKEEGVFIPRDIRDYRPSSRDEIPNLPERSQRPSQQAHSWQRSSQQRQHQQDQQLNQQPQYQPQHHHYQQQQQEQDWQRSSQNSEEANPQRPHKVITLRRNRAGGGEIWDRGHQLPGRNEVNNINTNLSDPFGPPQVLQQTESQLSTASGSPQKPEKKKDRKKKKKSVDEDVVEDKSEKKKDRKEKKGSKRGKKKPGADLCLTMNIETEKGVRELSYYEGEVPAETALAFCKKYNMGGDGDAQKVFAEALAVHICTNLDR